MADFTLIKANPSQGEITSSLTGSTGDGAGLHLENAGEVLWTNTSATNFGLSDFSVEFILNQTGDNTADNYIWFSNKVGNSRVYIYNDISDDKFRVVFVNSAGSSSGINFILPYDMSADYGTPTHYVLTCDRDGDATLYKNGNSVGAVSISGASTVNIGDGNTSQGRFGSSSTYGVLGTFYRFRTWNKLVDAKALYERADVDFADQYGGTANEITNGNFETNTSGWTSENTSTFQRNTTSPISGTGDLKWTGDGSGYPAAISNSFSLTAGKKYRIKFTYRVTSGTVYLKFGKTAGAASAAVAGISEVALTAASNTAYEATVTPTETTTAYIVFRGNNNTTPTMFVDLVDFVQIGCVSDYELSANPTQSLTVQDRSGNADATCLVSNVTQVQPVVQLNATAARIGTSAATPADGELLVSGYLGVGCDPSRELEVSGSGNVYARITARTANDSTALELANTGGTWTIVNDDTASETLKFKNGGAASDVRLSIDPNGQVTVNELAGSATNSTKLEVRSDADGSTSAIRTTNKDVTAGTNQAAGVDFGLSRNSGAFKPQAGQIKVGRESDWDASDTNIDSYMAFGTYGNNALGERMRIDSSGQITQTGEGVSYTIKNSDTSLGADQLIGGVAFEKSDGSGAGAGVVGGMRMHSEGAVGESSYLALSTADSSTNDVERLRIDSSGNITQLGGSPEYHFGTTSASHYNWRISAQETIDGAFEIASGTTSAGSNAASDTYTTRFQIAAATGAATFQKSDGAVVNLYRNDTTITDGNTFGRLQALSGDSNHTAGTEVGSIVFKAYGDQTGTRPRGQIRFQVANNASQAEAMRIEPDKKVTFYGGVTFGSGGTILDHYEEGTWTASLEFGGSTTGITYASNGNQGIYRRIGNMVYVSCIVSLSSKGSQTGSATIAGLPFIVSDEFAATSLENSLTSAYSNVGLAHAFAAGYEIQMRNASHSNLTNSDFSNTSSLRVSGWYTTP